MIASPYFFSFFFFNDTATTEIYTLSLHDALPICDRISLWLNDHFILEDHKLTKIHKAVTAYLNPGKNLLIFRSEEHTSELQSPDHLVCRLLLEKKKKEQKS